jgi:quercetin dioxygenase-like cupin family protein
MPPDARKIPYARPQPFGMIPDIVIPAVLDPHCDPRLWVPQSADVAFRPLLFNVTAGQYVNLLRVRRAGVLSRHRHSGAVHAVCLRGHWHYLEHDWVAHPGSFVFEPPGETHTLVVPDDVPEMITLFHVTGGYTYVSPDGVAEGYEDVFTKLEAARRHYIATGLGEAALMALVR